MHVPTQSHTMWGPQHRHSPVPFAWNHKPFPLGSRGSRRKLQGPSESILKAFSGLKFSGGTTTEKVTAQSDLVIFPTFTCSAKL